MPRRLIMSDIDGTFLNSQKQIPSETIEICRHLYQEKKTRFALASGRGMAGIRPVADAFGLPVFILPCNGAEIYDETGRLICQKTLLFQDVPAIKKTVKEINPQIETIVYAGQDWVADEFTDIVRGECYVMPTKPVIGSFETVVSPAAPVLKVICVGTPENTAELAERLRPVLPQYDLYKSQNYILEIVAKNVNKAAGLDFLCRRCGIDTAQTIAFGDGYNDIDMLKCAGIGIAMANAPDDVKRHADKITRSNDDNGIAAALKEIFY